MFPFFVPAPLVYLNFRHSQLLGKFIYFMFVPIHVFWKLKVQMLPLLFIESLSWELAILYKSRVIDIWMKDIVNLLRYICHLSDTLVWLLYKLFHIWTLLVCYFRIRCLKGAILIALSIINLMFDKVSGWSRYKVLVVLITFNYKRIF